jgi:hypothetical protein
MALVNGNEFRTEAEADNGDIYFPVTHGSGAIHPS